MSLIDKRGVEQKSVADYMPSIKKPVTENNTVMHTLVISQLGTAEVDEKYTFVNYDFAAAKNHMLFL